MIYTGYRVQGKQIPEPATIGSLAFGATLLALAKKRK
jgi:hypothetical protein